MKALSAFLLFSTVLVWPHAAVAGGSKASEATVYPVKYEGGSLRLDHRKVTATLRNEEVVLTAGRQRIAVPARCITEIAYGNEVRRRFGAAVLDVVPFLRLGESGTYYVGVSWVPDIPGATKSEAVFRLTAAEHRDLLAALERLTGKKAVDTNQVPTVVRYGL